jgi:hypothetical protein
MPQAVYVENPDDASKRVKPNTDGSVNVGNFPATQPVSVTNFPASQPVSVTNFPATQPVSGTVAVTTPIPAAGDLVAASRDTTGTLYTVPANRTFYGSVSVSGCVAVAGTSQPAISTPSGTIHKITINGLALVSVASANTISDVYINGGASGVAVTFTAGAAGTSTGQIAGKLL